MDMKTSWKKGSFTIEAAFLVPVILFLYLFILEAGIAFFRESLTRETYENLRELDVVERFLDIQGLRDFLEGE